MSWSMRILLLLGSVMTAVYVLRKVRKSKMRTEASVFWLLFSVVLVLLGLFPEIAIGVSEWVGIQSPANLVYLVVIFLLIIKLFLMDHQIAKLQDQLTHVAQHIAMRRTRREIPLRTRKRKEEQQGSSEYSEKQEMIQ